MPILEFNKVYISPHHSLDIYHHLFPNRPAFSLPCVIPHLSNLCLYNIPHPDFPPFLLLLLHPLLNFENGWDHGGLAVGERLSIAVANNECAVDLFLCEILFQKNGSKQKTARALRTNNCSIIKSYRSKLPKPHISLQTINNTIIIKSKTALQLLIYFTFITVLKNIKSLVKSHFTGYMNV